MSEEKKITAKKVLNRRFDGEVVSVAEDKTIHVLVISSKMHPKYRKQYTTSRKYPVHDEKNQAEVGDKVIFESCRPFSKTKRWRLIEVIK